VGKFQISHMSLYITVGNILGIETNYETIQSN